MTKSLQCTKQRMANSNGCYFIVTERDNEEMASLKNNLILKFKLRRACNLTAFIHNLTGPVGQPFASHHEGPGFNPQGVLMWNWDSPVSIVSLQWWPDVIDHCGLVWGGHRPKPSLGRCTDNVIIPLDLTQLFCPGFMLAGGPPSGFTTDIVSSWEELWGEPAISLHSYTVSLVQRANPLLPIMRDPGSIPREYICETRILLLALSQYKTNIHCNVGSSYEKPFFCTW